MTKTKKSPNVTSGKKVAKPAPVKRFSYTDEQMRCRHGEGRSRCRKRSGGPRFQFLCLEHANREAGWKPETKKRILSGLLAHPGSQTAKKEGKKSSGGKKLKVTDGKHRLTAVSS